jgi:hypothetical protein
MWKNHGTASKACALNSTQQAQRRRRKRKEDRTQHHSRRLQKPLHLTTPSQRTSRCSNAGNAALVLSAWLSSCRWW